RGRQLVAGRAADERAHGGAGDRLAVAVEDAALDRATADQRELGDAPPGRELDATRARVAGRVRVGDPRAVRHALNAEHAVVAAARVARRLIVRERPQLDGRDDARALGTIEHAADDDRAAL